MLLLTRRRLLTPSFGRDGDKGSVVALVEGWEYPCLVDRFSFSLGWDPLFRDRLDLLVRILLRMLPYGFEECLCRNPPSRPSH